jgi:hypothetical protein
MKTLVFTDRMGLLDIFDIAGLGFDDLIDLDPCLGIES